MVTREAVAVTTDIGIALKLELQTDVPAARRPDSRTGKQDSKVDKIQLVGHVFHFGLQPESRFLVLPNVHARAQIKRKVGTDTSGAEVHPIDNLRSILSD